MAAGGSPRLRRVGAAAAVAGLAADQASKLWLLFGYGIEARQPLEILPFFEFVAVWNFGISYGLFQQDSTAGQLALLAIAAAALVLLASWLWRAHSPVVAVSLGLVIGGAVGNGIDRLAYGAVFDFAHFHVGSFSWYIFNLADVWIVAGVAGLLYDTLVARPEKATKRD